MCVHYLRASYVRALRAQGVAKIADLGLAKVSRDMQASMLTSSGPVSKERGTPLYMGTTRSLSHGFLIFSVLARSSALERR